MILWPLISTLIGKSEIISIPDWRQDVCPSRRRKLWTEVCWLSITSKLQNPDRWRSAWRECLPSPRGFQLMTSKPNLAVSRWPCLGQLEVSGNSWEESLVCDWGHSFSLFDERLVVYVPIEYTENRTIECFSKHRSGDGADKRITWRTYWFTYWSDRWQPSYCNE